MLRKFPARVSHSEIDRVLHDMSDGVTHMVAVEVFGPPEAMTYIKSEDTMGGPWIIGPADEVYESLVDHPYDWETQYETGQPAE